MRFEFFVFLFPSFSVFWTLGTGMRLLLISFFTFVDLVCGLHEVFVWFLFYFRCQCECKSLLWSLVIWYLFVGFLFLFFCVCFYFIFTYLVYSCWSNITTIGFTTHEHIETLNMIRCSKTEIYIFVQYAFCQCIYVYLLRLPFSFSILIRSVYIYFCLPMVTVSLFFYSFNTFFLVFLCAQIHPPPLPKQKKKEHKKSITYVRAICMAWIRWQIHLQHVILSFLLSACVHVFIYFIPFILVQSHCLARVLSSFLLTVS